MPECHDPTLVLAADKNGKSTGCSITDETADSTCEESENEASNTVGSCEEEDTPVLARKLSCNCRLRSVANSAIVPAVLWATGSPEGLTEKSAVSVVSTLTAVGTGGNLGN